MKPSRTITGCLVPEARIYRPASAGGYAHHAGTARGADPGSSPAGQARGAARIPPFADGQGNSLAHQWPLRSFLELGALPGAVPCARLHARQVLWEWGLATLSEHVELLVTELTSNSVTASRSLLRDSPVRLWLLSDGKRVLILVHDANPKPPVPATAGDEDENGRGLLLVEAMSDQWSWYPLQETGGKVVWALVQAARAPAMEPARDERDDRV